MALRTRKGRARELAEVVLISVILALFVRTFLVQAFAVPSGSMEKTVLVGDHLLVNKFLFASHGRFLSDLLPYRAVQRGDVIVFKFPKDPSTDYIKRVVALPGDLLEIRERIVYINGVAEPPRAGAQTDLSAPPSRTDWLGPRRILPGHYFAMGDNRESSYDSRYWGPVPGSNLKGRALVVYWSLRPDPPAKSGNPIQWLVDFVHSTRWSRTFQWVR